MADQEYKLTYFDVKARGETIRFLLSYGNIPFEDRRIEKEDWIPKEKAISPFGKLPYLDIGPKRIHQSVAICRYLANKVKLAGDNEDDKLMIDIAVDTINDMRAPVVEYIRAKRSGDDATAAVKKAATLADTLPYYLPKLEQLVKENQGHFVNGKLTWGDFYWAAMADNIACILEIKDMLAEYPTLKALQSKVEAIPAVAAWIAKRPHTSY